MKRLFLSLTSLLFVGWLQAQTVQRVQWWFDADYSLCNTDSTTSTALWHLDIDASQLRDGFHTLYLHLQDTSGMWGSPRSFLFYKSPQVDSTGQANLVYTCWYDQDYSHHISGTITGGTMLIDASQLRDGFHTVNIQLGDGATARLKSYLIYKQLHLADDSSNIELVYWYDGEDQLTLRRSSPAVGLHLLDVPAMECGEQTINLALKDSRGNMTSLIKRDFILLDSACCLPDRKSVV